MPARLQYIIEANHITHDIGIGIGDVIAYTSLGSEIHHHLRLILLKDAVNGLLVGNITLDELPCDTFRNCCVKLIQPVFL